jgi:hypothetical protein
MQKCDRGRFADAGTGAGDDSNFLIRSHWIS